MIFSFDNAAQAVSLVSPDIHITPISFPSILMVISIIMLYIYLTSQQVVISVVSVVAALEEQQVPNGEQETAGPEGT